MQPWLTARTVYKTGDSTRPLSKEPLGSVVLCSRLRTPLQETTAPGPGSDRLQVAYKRVSQSQLITQSCTRLATHWDVG